MFYVCGFVPWHVRRLESTGDLVPEVIPLGTFSWYVELRSEREKKRNNQEKKNHNENNTRISYVPAIIDETKISTRKNWGKEWNNEPNAAMKPAGKTLKGDRFDASGKPLESFSEHGGPNRRIEVGHPVGSKNVRKDQESKYVQYRIRVNEGGLTEEEVYIYDFVPARYEISMNSMMYATVVSPLSHLLVDYKNLRQAQIRRSHADAWNTQSHLITTFKPGSSSNNVPEWKGSCSVLSLSLSLFLF